MTDLKMTNPTNTPNDRKEQSSSFDYRQKVVQAWIDMGIPLRPAETAGIDMTSQISIAYKQKLLPEQTAKLLVNDVVAYYTNKDGDWHYQQSIANIEETNTLV